jgi:hypothetical protein
MPTHHASEDRTMNSRMPCALVAAIAIALAATAVVPRALAATTPGPKHFASPEDAVAAFVAAVRADNPKALLAVLGPDGKRVAESGDTVADREGRERFAASYDEKHQIVKSSDTQAILETGKDDWPMPIPIVKDASGWRFDTKAGEKEILARRIGRNELDTIQTMLAIVDAQREYYELDPDKSGLLHYAEYFLSRRNLRNGLYYPTKEGEPESPLGDLIAEARAEGYTEAQGKPTPYHGYHYRMLTAQGPHAQGGAYSYLAKGKLMGGFAALAYPATWGASGVMTFVVNQDGVVYEKDLGPNTAAIAKAMTKFDPDDTWKAVSEDDEVVPSESAQ